MEFLVFLLILIAVIVVLGLLFLFRPTASKKVAVSSDEPVTDVVLIGGGIMSATLGTLLRELEPNWQIRMYERLDNVAKESSFCFNNAGTGHSAFCEMNYTAVVNGKIDASRAEKIAAQFEISKQFWSHQVKKGVLGEAQSFIHAVPHISFVWGDNVDFLRKRYDAMIGSSYFYGMKYSEDAAEITQWAPLVMNGRDTHQKVAATRMDLGTDINFGEITTQLVGSLEKDRNFQLQTSTEVTAISRNDDQTWTVSSKDLKTGKVSYVKTRHVFVGAGGATIRLLQMTGLEETKQYAGFPVGGLFMMTDNQEIAQQYTAKVYGRAELGAPPMSVPHIDTRYVDGKKYVLFGPFATYSNKFLKQGSQLDLLASTNKNNVLPMIAIGLKNFDLVKYLISQVMMSDKDRLKELQKYFPKAELKDWKMSQAGQRVQIIKKVEGKPATLQFGTEIFTSKDKTVTGLLGASPGASVSPYVMLDLIEQVFPEKVAGEWQTKLNEIIPHYGKDLGQHPELLDEVRQDTSKTLGLVYEPINKS